MDMHTKRDGGHTPKDIYYQQVLCPDSNKSLGGEFPRNLFLVICNIYQMFYYNILPQPLDASFDMESPLPGEDDG